MKDQMYASPALRGLRTELLTMGSLVQMAYSKARTALLLRDVAAAEDVVKSDDAIDEMELELDEKCTSIIARTQPVARDLRFILTAVRMVLDLERIADESVTIGRQIPLLPESFSPKLEKDLARYLQLAFDMLDTALDAFRKEDVPHGMQVFQHSEESVRLLLSMYEKLMVDVRASVVDPSAAVPLILVVRSVDRICRRSENIVEHLCFMCDGITVKHRVKLSGMDA
ncbi:phosphate signaling complex protein PhoU [Mailhella massiliensis]|uniref:phosphate signaling complex protein PhoU n=1 Tax=Mailhella massiliensis TaxID=1903261 RepID=UPI00235686F9|nr:phosphate signaling complex protein PhoU [Mailhella massiliensis]